MTFQESQNALLQSYLDTYAKPLKSLELIISSQCDQNCAYCYLQQHGKEMNYPRANKKEDILNNLVLLLNYLEKENYQFEVYDIFSGEFFRLPYWEDVFSIIYNHQLKTKKKRFIDIPTNFSFCADSVIYDKVEKWIKIFRDIDCQLHLSCSIDGPEKTESIARPNYIAIKDEEFYDKVFSLAAKYSFAFHPMISKHFLQNYKENYDWFINNILKYNVRFTDTNGNVTINPPMMLEVRDPGQWDEETLKLYKEFLNYVADKDLEILFDGDKKKMAYKMFDDSTDVYVKCTDVARSQPYIISYPYLIGNVMSCSIQQNLAVRVGDLTMAPCHRLYYSEFEYGKFVTNEDKSEIIGVEGKNPTLAFKVKTFNPIRSNLKCGGCDLKAFCLQGCFGSQYEHTHEIFANQDEICRMFEVKYKTVHEICERLGLYDIIMKDNLVPASRKEFITYAKPILSRM